MSETRSIGQVSQVNRPQSAKVQTRPQSAKMIEKKQQFETEVMTSSKVKMGNFLRTEIEKDKTHPYFKQSVVGACSRVVLVKGVPKAVPYFQTPKKTPAQLMKRLGINMSLSQEQYAIVPKVSVGTRRKPLSAYNPNARRNRMPIPEMRMPYRNASQIQIGHHDLRSQKQFISYAHNQYGNHARLGFNTNTQIISDKTKFHKHNQEQ